MITARTALFAGLLGLGLFTTGCTRGRAVAAAASPEAQSDASANAATGSVARTEVPRPAPKVQIRIDVEGLDGIIAAVADVGRRLDPDGQWDLEAHIQAALLTTGFGPAYFRNLDLAGRQALALGLAHGDESLDVDDLDLAGVIAVVDARTVIANLPASSGAQPLGAGLWELRSLLDETRILLREGNHRIEFGLDPADLDLAATLGTEPGGGRRVRARAWNLPFDELASRPDEADDNELIDGLSELVRDLETVSAELDFGLDRDFEFVLAATGSSDRLAPITSALGPPRAVATQVESLLAGGADAVVSLSLGDLKPLGGALARAVGEGSDELERRAVTRIAGLAEQLAGDVVMAFYLAPNAQATVVVAARVRDEAAARAELSSSIDVLDEALQAARDRAGPDAAAVQWRRDRVATAAGRADHLSISVPRDADRAPDLVPLLIRKGRIETVALVHEHAVIVAVGANARDHIKGAARRSGRARPGSLAHDPGLARVRTALGGCQLCVAADAVEVVRARTAARRSATVGSAPRAELSRALKELGAMKVDAKGSFGLRLEGTQATGAVVVPKTLLFAPASTLKRLVDIAEDLESPVAKVEPPAA